MITIYAGARAGVALPGLWCSPPGVVTTAASARPSPPAQRFSEDQT